MTTKKIFVVVLLALIMAMSTSAVAAVYAQGNQTSTTSTITIPSWPIDTLTLSVATVVAILGTITAAILGWQESGEPFDSGKFLASILHAFIAGAAIIVGFGFGPSINFLDYLVIYLAGAGVDVLLNRVTGAIVTKAASVLSAKAQSTTSAPGQTQTTQPGQPPGPPATPAPSPPAASPS
jgi:hypothetical protein